MASAKKIIDDIAKFFQYFIDSNCSRRGKMLALIIFGLFLVNLWPLFHWQLWALRIEFYHLIIYLVSLILIGILFSTFSSNRILANGPGFGRLLSYPKTILLSLCAIHLAIAILLSVYVLERIPHTSDGVFYLFQAKIFSEGHLYLPVPKYGEFLADDHILMNEGRSFTIYPPGWPALLMLGEKLGKPWLMNPLLSTGLVFVVYLCGREMYGRKVGLLAAALATPSPFLMVMATSFYSHTSCALFCAIYLLCVLKAIKENRRHWYLLAGSCLAMAFLIRPYTAVVFGLPGMLFLLYLLILKKKPLEMGRAFLLTVSIIIAVSILMFYNLKTTGDPFKAGYSLKFGTLTLPGFGNRQDLDNVGDNSMTGEFLPTVIQHTPWRGFMIQQSNWASINFLLFGWPIPSLIFLISWFFARDCSRSEKIVWASIGGLIIGYIMYYYRAERLMTESLPWIIVMSACGIERAHERSKSRAVSRTGIPLVVAICMTYAIFVFYPVNLISSLPSRGWLNTELPELVKEKEIHNAVVFIDSQSGEKNMVPGFVPHQSYLWNKLRPEEGDVVYLRDLGDRNTEIGHIGNDRAFWRYSYDVMTERGELLPLPASL